MVLFFCAHASAADLLPEDFVLQEGFEPGYGPSVGRVVLVQGEVVILHAGEVIGYRAEQDLPLYKGDTLISLVKGRIRIRLNDQSVITLASNTKLAITRSVYEPKKKTRTSFLRLSIGKARFWVKKLAGFRRSQVRVKSATAVIGVRGTIFALEATPDNTKATNLGDKEEPGSTIWIETTTPGGPKEELGEGYQGQAPLNEPIVKIQLSVEQLETIRQFFEMLQEVGKPSVAVEGQKKPKKKTIVIDPEGKLVVEGFEESGEVIIVDQEVTKILQSFLDQNEFTIDEVKQDLIPEFPEDFPPPPSD
jgi:hypothetical protein